MFPTKRFNINEYNESVSHLSIANYISINRETIDSIFESKDYVNDEKYDIDYHMSYLDDDKTILKIDFQETKSKTDWKVNLKFVIKKIKYKMPTKPYRFSKLWFAHGGFVKAYKNIHNVFLDEIEKNENIEHIIIRGYSQGAAYTILCTEDIIYNLESMNRVANVYSIAIAPPRVIWGLFSWNVNKRVKRVKSIQVHGDPVTRVPPIYLGFKHVGNRIKLGKWFKSLYPYFPKNHLKDAYRDGIDNI